MRTETFGQSTPSKPSSRLQSRPLSSTTTATNTTITPGTPRPRKRPPSALPIPEPRKFPEPPSSPSSRPGTPKASAARKKLHTLFGIPPPSPKRSSFTSSRHSSRRTSIDSPAQAHSSVVEDNDPTLKPLDSYSPDLHSRPQSPDPDPQSKMSSNPSMSSMANSSSGSSRLQRFFTGQKTSPPPPSTDAVSGPMRRPSVSSHLRRNSTSNSARGNSPTISSSDTPTTRPNPSGSMGPPAVPPPRIVHIPPTPLRSERPGTAPQTQASSSLGHSSHKSSADSGRGDGLGSMHAGHLRMKMSRPPSHRSTKHGSFDFERPGWGAGAVAMQRTGSNGTSGTVISGTETSLSGWGRALDTGVRESAMGPGLAGVGTLQREISLKRGKEREEMINRAREEDRRRRKTEGAERAPDILNGSTKNLSPRPMSPEENRAATSASMAKNSSWGRKRGALFGSGKANITSLGVCHGQFAFEPPVPSPTRSTTSAGIGHDAPLSVTWAGEKGRDARAKADLEREREREKWKEREKEKRSQSTHRGDRAPVPVPSAGYGHRSGTKGRSLDLGLGLSWAPSSVREDALLPSSGYFGRSASGSSGARSVGSAAGKSVSASANGHTAIEEERSILGNHVAEVFKNALDEAGYVKFRQCTPLFLYSMSTALIHTIYHLTDPQA
ncbi:hypothetical protein H0H81_004157 [Sphagnurus paluster]|uniref:Uncharacterized protein n=1 Tax=Sphagnurus paluster TaxID=117069 RepID=A0A9P7KLF4_9AGAR|nr:hypothetical protein H0H81_004157 [Sphagnurus paluster]